MSEVVQNPLNECNRNQLYLFEDWTSASLMRNTINCNLKIEVFVIRKEDRTGIEGYQLVVYDSRTDKTVYKYYIDYGAPGSWSLSTEEAVRMLNQIGFNCEFNREHYKISREVWKILDSVYKLGYTHIRREIRPAIVVIYHPDKDKWLPLDLVTEYCYHDFGFIKTELLDPTRIKGILEDYDVSD